MTTMTYDGYVATIELDEDVGLFHGEVINTRDVLTFQGRTLDELRPLSPTPSPTTSSGAGNGASSRSGPIRGILPFGFPPSCIVGSLRPPPGAAKASTHLSRRRLSGPRNDPNQALRAAKSMRGSISM